MLLNVKPTFFQKKNIVYEVDITPTHYFKFHHQKHYDVVARVLVHMEESGDNIDYKKQNSIRETN